MALHSWNLQKAIYATLNSATITGATVADVPVYDDVPEGTSCLLYTSPSPRDRTRSRMPSSA